MRILVLIVNTLADLFTIDLALVYDRMKKYIYIYLSVCVRVREREIIGFASLVVK
jgi:hypothetical protein